MRRVPGRSLSVRSSVWYPIPPRTPPAWLLELNGAPPFDRYLDAVRWCFQFRRRHASNPEFASFLSVVGRWQTDPATCRDLKRQAVHFTHGGVAVGADVRILLRALAVDHLHVPELYRGTFRRGSERDVAARFPVNSDLVIPLTSFSSNRLIAEEFSWINAEKGIDTEVLLVLQAGSSAVRLDVLAPDEIHWREREWYSGGRYTVADAFVASKGRVEVVIEQKGVLDVA